MSTRLDLFAEALFVSEVQPSETFSPEFVRDLVSVTVELHGPAGLAAVVAQEFGDHPDAACCRMRWCRRVVAEAFTTAAV